MRKQITPLFLWTSVATAQIITNALYPVETTPTTLAPEMLATLGLAPDTLSHVLIRPAGSLTATPATITSPTTFLVPAGIPIGTAELIWQITGGTYQSTDVTIAPSNFQLGPNPTGLTTPARPGQTISLTGTGLGFGTQVTAVIGGLPATVLYAGRGTPAGVDLIQLQIPTGVADGCYVPLILNFGQSAVTSAISVTSTGAPCQHPLNLSLTDLKNLDSGGILNVAEVELNTQFDAPLASAANRQETGYIEVFPLTPTQVAQMFIPRVATGCSSTSTGATFVELLGNLYNPAPSPPNPGSTLTLANTAGTFYAQSPGGVGGPAYTVTLPAPQDGTLAAPPAPAIAPGKWTLTTPGSPDLPPSTFNFTLPAPVQLTQGAPVALAHNQPQTIAWNGAGFDPAAIAQISLFGPSQFVSCTVPAQSGSVTIPASLLAPFAANTMGTISITVTPGPNAIPGTSFRTTSGIPLAFTVGYLTSDTRPVDFQ